MCLAATHETVSISFLAVQINCHKLLTDQDERSILFRLAQETHTALRVILNFLMENDASSGGQHPDGERTAKSCTQAADDEAAEPLDVEHPNVHNPRRQQHALSDKRSAPTESSSGGQHLTGTQFSGERESVVRNSRLVISDISCCPGRVRHDCRQYLSSIGCTCVCSPVDIMDFKHGLQKAAAVENFALPTDCKFDITILYGICYGTHGQVTARGVDAHGVEEQMLRSCDQWSVIDHQYKVFQEIGKIPPGQVFTQSVLGQEAGTTVVLVEPFNFMNWQSNNLEIPTLHARLLNRSHYKGRTSRNFTLRASDTPLSCFVASDQIATVASYCIRNKSGQMQLDLALMIQTALHHGKWIHWAACGRMDFAYAMLDQSLFTETLLAQSAPVCCGPLMRDWIFTKKIDVWIPFSWVIQEGSDVCDDDGCSINGRVNLKRVLHWCQSRQTRWRLSTDASGSSLSSHGIIQ